MSGPLQAVPSQFSAGGRLKSMQAQGSAPALKESHKLSQLSMQTTPSRLSIDTTRQRQEMGYYNLLPNAYRLRDWALGEAALGLADTVAAGNRMQRVESGENAIPAIAFDRMFIDLRDNQYGLDYIPKTPPKIHFTPGTLSIDLVF